MRSDTLKWKKHPSAIGRPIALSHPRPAAMLRSSPGVCRKWPPGRCGRRRTGDEIVSCSSADSAELREAVCLAGNCVPKAVESHTFLGDSEPEAALQLLCGLSLPRAHAVRTHAIPVLSKASSVTQIFPRSFSSFRTTIKNALKSLETRLRRPLMSSSRSGERNSGSNKSLLAKTFLRNGYPASFNSLNKAMSRLIL